MKLHIGLAAPIATEHVTELLTGETSNLPQGYTGAPFTGALIAEFLKQGHKISAFTTDASLYPDIGVVKVGGPNFDLYICPERPRAWRFNQSRVGRALDGFGFERQVLAETIKSAQPDIIHAHWTYEFALAAIKTNIPHLITCHDDPAVILRFNPYPFRAIRYLMARQVYRKGQCFSTVSDYMVSQVRRYTKTPLTVVPNPLADFVLASGREREVPVTRRIGLICNGWEARKNAKPALQAFAKIRAGQPGFELHLFGHGFGEQQAAQQWCLEQGLADGMVFHGSTPHKQLIAQLNQLDLLLHPSLEESFGVVIAEAMALGLPIVAGRHSGAAPWVVGFEENSEDICCAVLTDVSDPAAIASAIEKVFDPYYSARSAAGYARARQQFAPDVIANAYMALYQRILSGLGSSII